MAKNDCIEGVDEFTTPVPVHPPVWPGITRTGEQLPGPQTVVATVRGYGEVGTPILDISVGPAIAGVGSIGNILDVVTNSTAYEITPDISGVGSVAPNISRSVLVYPGITAVGDVPASVIMVEDITPDISGVGAIGIVPTILQQVTPGISGIGLGSPSPSVAGSIYITPGIDGVGLSAATVSVAIPGVVPDIDGVGEGPSSVSRAAHVTPDIAGVGDVGVILYEATAADIIEGIGIAASDIRYDARAVPNVFGIGLSASVVDVAGGATYTFTNTEASTFVGNLTSSPDDTRKKAYDDFYTRIKLQSTLDQLDSMHLIGVDAQASQLNLADDGATAAVPFNTVGIVSDRYFDTIGSDNSGWESHLAAADSGKASLGDFSFGAWWFQYDANSTTRDLRTSNNSTFYRSDFNPPLMRITNGSNIGNTGDASVPALIMGIHDSAVNADGRKAYRNGELLNSTSGTGGAISGQLQWGASNNPNDSHYGALIAGAALDSDQNWVLYEAIRRYLYDIGALGFPYDPTGNESTNLEDDADWTRTGGTAGDASISAGGIIQIQSAGADGYYLASFQTVDGYIDTAVPGNGANNSASFAAMRIADEDNFVGWRYTSGAIEFLKFVGGVSTFFGSHSVTLSDGDIVRLHVRGDEARVLLNGTEVLGWSSLGGDLSANSGVGFVGRSGLLEVKDFNASPDVEVFTDDFNRPDEQLEASANWDEITTGNSRIVGEALSINLGLYLVSSSLINSDDAYAQLFFASGTQRLIARYTDVDNYVYLRTAGNAVELYKRVAGVETRIGIQFNEAANNQTRRLEVKGDNARVLVDGAEALGWTSLGGDLATGGRVGIGHTTGDVAGHDNFEAGTLL